jgi:hypothetical protein
MTDFVDLAPKRNRGWPWPEDSFGLTPMFGEDGWCHSCGVPRREQTGSLVLQRKQFKTTGRVWMPEWLFDVVCGEREFAESLAAEYRLEWRDVEWRGEPPVVASQLVVPVVGERWFDPDELGARTTEAHGKAGAECPECGVWRWLPLGFTPLPPMSEVVFPPLLDIPELDAVDVAASPEFFGDGMQAYRLLLFRRELADALVAASPRDFEIVTPSVK